jgi:hypothetical protein
MGNWSNKTDEACRAITSEYNQEVTSLANEVRERVKAGDDVGDVVHELVDGHAWVIYTYSNWLVTLASNSDPFEYLSDMGTTEFSPALLAYACLYQDVSEEVARLDDSEPSDEEDES